MIQIPVIEEIQNLANKLYMRHYTHPSAIYMGQGTFKRLVKEIKPELHRLEIVNEGGWQRPKVDGIPIYRVDTEYHLQVA